MLATLLLGAALPGCSTPKATTPAVEFLDEGTGSTVRAAARPLVFARERSDLAANARDYVTLEPAILDNGGHLQYVLVGYLWSTVDARLDEHRPGADADIILTADDRQFRLRPAPRPARAPGLQAAPGTPPGAHRTGRIYATDLPTLRYLAAARQLHVAVGTRALDPTYPLWQDGRGALAVLLDPDPRQ